MFFCGSIFLGHVASDMAYFVRAFEKPHDKFMNLSWRNGNE